MATVQDLLKTLQRRGFTDFKWHHRNNDPVIIKEGAHQPSFFDFFLGAEPAELHYSHQTPNFNVEEQPISLENALAMFETREEHENLVKIGFEDSPDKENVLFYHIIYDPKSGNTTTYVTGLSARANIVVEKLTLDQWTNLVQAVDEYNKARATVRTAFRAHFDNVV